MWEMTSPDGEQWVRWHDDGFVEASRDLLGPILAAEPVEIAPLTGRYYTPSGPGDPVGAFLHGQRRIGSNAARVTGTPPVLPPAVPAGAPTPDLVF